MRRLLLAVRHLPEEVLFFAREGAYGLFIGIVYWFVSYETAGTVLLVLFGAGASILALILFAGSRSRRTDELDGNTGEGGSLQPDGVFGDESGRLPGPGFAPLEVGFGISLAALGIVFGPWLLVAAAVPLANGGRLWLRGASRELAAVEREDEAAAG